MVPCWYAYFVCFVRGVNMPKKTESVNFRADPDLCARLDSQRGALSRSAFVREIVNSGLRLRSGALKPWIGECSAGDRLRFNGAARGDRPGL